MRLDRKGFVRMGGVLILTLLISGCSEEQKIKWEVNKQIRRIKSKNVEVRVDAAEALGQIGPAAIMALIQALKDKGDSSVRYSSGKALGQIGPKAKAAVPALAQALKDEDEWVRANAAEALGRIGPEAKAAVPALIQALKNEDVLRVRWGAAEALGQIGPAAKQAVPALAQALKDIEDSYSPYFRESAVEALEKINIEAEATEDAKFDF